MDFRSGSKRINKGKVRNNEIEHIHKLILQRNNFCNKECKSKEAYYTPKNYCGLHQKIELKNREKWE